MMFPMRNPSEWPPVNVILMPSKPSMDGVFNIRRTSRQSWLSALMGSRYSDFYGVGFSGNGAVQNILKENGYETFGLFSSYYFSI